MICQNCLKEEASIKYRENINGKKKELNICSNCFKKLDLTNSTNMLSYFFTSHPKQLDVNEYTDKVCSKCSFTFDDYLNKGFFGCPNCYNDFSDKIDMLLTKIHGKNRHINQIKQVKGKKLDNNINELKEQLVICIKEENYEEAARIRDNIREIEK